MTAARWKRMSWRSFLKGDDTGRCVTDRRADASADGDEGGEERRETCDLERY